MIRLKTLLLETKLSDKLHVLFVTDNDLDRRRGFARQLINNQVITGDIRTADKGSVKQLKDLVIHHVSTHYDLVVIFTRGIYEKNKNQEVHSIIDNLRRIIEYCKSLNIPVVLNTIPSVRFIKPTIKKKLNIDFTLADDLETDNWIRKHADYVLLTDSFTDDVFFDKTNVHLDRPAHIILYDEMLEILNDLDNSINVDAEEEKVEDDELHLTPGYIGIIMEDVHKFLQRLGYDIDSSEILTMEFGSSTIEAITDFKMKHGLNASEVIDDETMDALRIAKPKKQISTKGKVIIPSGLAADQADNIELLIAYMNEKGITNPFTQIGILSVIGKESGFIPQDEIGYGGTPNNRIREIFGNRVPADDDELNTLKADDEAFFNRVYGGRFGNAPDEGYLYRGRGFNGLTFKDNYQKYGSIIGKDLVGDPEQANDPEVASEIAIAFFTKNKPADVLPKFTSKTAAATYFVNLNAGGTGRAEDHSRASDWTNKFEIEFE
jgi:predicted chitinase